MTKSAARGECQRSRSKDSQRKTKRSNVLKRDAIQKQALFRFTPPPKRIWLSLKLIPNPQGPQECAERICLGKQRLAVPREPFDDPDWLYELKYDGFRALAYIESGSCKLVSRNAHLYKSFPGLRPSL